MKSYLWKVDREKLNKTNLASYSNFIRQNYKINSGNDFNKIWKWSVDKPKVFWKSIWDFTKVKGSLGNVLLKESAIFHENKFFPEPSIASDNAKQFASFSQKISLPSALRRSF